jgi:GTP-binding protein
VRVDDSTEFVVADIPGIIEGASEGRGLGHQFLRHIERARALCILVDLAPMDGMAPEEQERVLLRELEAYDPNLVERPRIVVGSKVDVADAAVVESWSGLTMSAVTRQGVRAVVGKLAQIVSQAREAIPPREATVILRPEPGGTYVERVGENEFRIHGRNAVRSVALNDITSPEALNYIDERLKKMGVGRLLSRAGAQDGDVVHIGEFSFEYTAEL